MTRGIYASTIFLGALLLFSVQPMIGKYILPWFGGGPAVWTTCMLFFQLVLLVGYAYAHFNIRFLKPRSGAILHLVLLVAAVALLPIIPSSAWKPQDASDPTLRILLLLGVTLGVPYLVLSATSPLLQAWLGRLNPGRSPYRLYSLSNVGSLLALLSYPFLVEPYLTRKEQAWIWSIALMLYAVFCAVCTILAWQAKPIEAVPDAPAAKADDPSGGMLSPDGDRASAEPAAPVPATAGVRLLWLALPACAVVLLLAVTNALGQEVGAIPFLWVVPLALYLLSFVICFDHQRWYVRGLFIPLTVLATLALAFFMFHALAHGSRPLWQNLLAYLTPLFLACMTCHGELYRLKPDLRHLTGFYLMIAAGGAIGGILVAIVAPAVFTGFFELHIGLVACLLLVVVCLQRDNGVIEWRSAYCALIILATVGAGWMLYRSVVDNRNDLVAACRNFYGTLTVQEFNRDMPDYDRYVMRHGRITHGTQLRAEKMQSLPTTYFGYDSGAGRVLRAMSQSHRRIGIVGLGAGTLASYGKSGDFIRFYEINPQVKDLAEKYFTYLRRCGAQLEIMMGDARLSLERQTPQQYDLLVIDAFSGDAIPAHLLTREAFEIYRRHLKPNGVLAVHISNLYYDLEPIVCRLAQEFGMKSMVVVNKVVHPVNFDITSGWVLLSTDGSIFSDPLLRQAGEVKTYPQAQLWTDDKANLLGAMR